MENGCSVNIKKRDTFELAGGHREENETILETASRELREETGAEEFEIKPVCVYSVTGKTRVVKEENVETFGMLFCGRYFLFWKNLK